MAIEIWSQYKPNGWQLSMHPDSFRHGCLVGGKGGGKTRAAIEELLACAHEYPGSAYLIGRKTLPSLKDSTWREFIEALHPDLIADYNKTERLVTLHCGSYFMGRPLDEPKKFESIKISGFMLDEADEIDKDVYDVLKSRVRQILRGPQGQKIQPRYRTFLVLNPCEETHWIPQLFLQQRPPDHKLFYSTTIDNLENLPEDYVQQLESIYSKDMQQRMIYGQWSKVHRGRPVFPQFARGHFIEAIEPIEKAPIYRCIDFGFRKPACVWLQFNGGQLRVLASRTGKDIYLDDFLKEVVFPYEQSLWGDWRWGYQAFCDPAGAQESDKGKTSIEILNDFGIFPKHRKTRIEEGIKAIKHFLDTQKDNVPNLLIHPRCTILIEAFRGGYHRLDGEDTPNKDGIYDHEMDAFRYGATYLFRWNRFGDFSRAMNERPVYVNPRTGRRVELLYNEMDGEGKKGF